MLVVHRQKAVNSFVKIHNSAVKTKSMLFSMTKFLKEINISFAGYPIKQYDTVQHLGCQLHSKLSGETMASNVLRKVNAKL